VEEPAALIAVGGVRGFPALPTSFIGRAGPVRELTALVEQYRLVTVTGPGGAGKTRLASEAARQVSGRFADGRGWSSWLQCWTRGRFRRSSRRRWAEYALMLTALADLTRLALIEGLV
jgi:hypothetical protein